MARLIEDEFGYLQQLLENGKKRGYVLYDEVNDSLPPDLLASHEIARAVKRHLKDRLDWVADVLVHVEPHL